MGSVIVVAVVVMGTWLMIRFVRNRRWGLEARRGMSIGADLGMLRDTPKATVREVTAAAPDRAQLVLTPEGAGDDAAPPPDIVVVVALTEEDFGFELLRKWQHDGTAIAVVMPPGSHLVRLRSTDDLQPLTLHRIDTAR